MNLIASLQEIDACANSIFVMHEKCEKYISLHQHSKNQLTYVEGGLAYLRFREKLFAIPARHYFWIPAGVEHTLRIGDAETSCRTLFFHTHGDAHHEFYSRPGIYPINDLLFHMIRYTGHWNGHILPGDERFTFLQSIRNILPQVSHQTLSVPLPFTDNKRMLEIITYLEDNLSENHSLRSISVRFGISERNLSRFFQSTLKISFFAVPEIVENVTGFPAYCCQ